ncbi:hypothetical protein ACL02O_23715 [Micromonospora sp. MS34]|uniref:hypothetical protein n=1 Tax=Micromonospora sp. MS34 TaxID=3385971 RepID=UPI00399F948D
MGVVEMASKRLGKPVRGSLASAVEEMVSALPLGPQHAALVAAARMLAETLDGMSPDVRERMAGQTVGSLLATLKALREAAPVPVAAKVTALDELRARHAARLARAEQGRAG